jgi:hypothetical protein
LAGIIDNLIVGNGREAPKHELDHGPQAQHRRSHSHADECRLADRGVHDTLVAKSFPKPSGDLVSAIILRDLFADEDHVGVAFDFLCKRLIESFAIFDKSHDSEKC